MAAAARETECTHLPEVQALGEDLLDFEARRLDPAAIRNGERVREQFARDHRSAVGQSLLLGPRRSLPSMQSLPIGSNPIETPVALIP